MNQLKQKIRAELDSQFPVHNARALDKLADELCAMASEEIKNAFDAGRNRLPMAWDGASEPMYDSAEEYLNYINQ